ncbi:MAG: hypothetical protein MUE81_23220 [Thermoflexibacter sp.]|jgi:hypothetical protein|nr:hypothetical protein [Thermoflexibacter sp.]
MKKSIVLFALFVFALVNNLLAQSSSETLAKNVNPTKVVKEATKKVEANFSKEEVKFIEEINTYYQKKYENPLKALESKLEKVIVIDAAGKIVLEANLSDHKVHDSQLPEGAEKLMERGNTVYYMIIK